MNKNIILIEYQAITSNITDAYLAKYLQQVAKENRTVDTAGEFLKIQDEQFREKIASAFVNVIARHRCSQEVQKALLEHNKWAIGKLAVEVMNASTDKPTLGTMI